MAIGIILGNFTNADVVLEKVKFVEVSLPLGKFLTLPLHLSRLASGHLHTPFSATPPSLLSPDPSSALTLLPSLTSYRLDCHDVAHPLPRLAHRPLQALLGPSSLAAPRLFPLRQLGLCAAPDGRTLVGVPPRQGGAEGGSDSRWIGEVYCDGESRSAIPVLDLG